MRYAIEGVVELFDGQHGPSVGYGDARHAYHVVPGTGEGWFDSAVTRPARYFRPAVVDNRAAAVHLALMFNAKITVLEDMQSGGAE